MVYQIVIGLGNKSVFNQIEEVITNSLYFINNTHNKSRYV
jgi:hypothetical protein